MFFHSMTHSLLSPFYLTQFLSACVYVYVRVQACVYVRINLANWEQEVIDLLKQ